MYYKKEETYSFSIPREYNAYLKYRKELIDAGIDFTESEGPIHQIITIRTSGRFDAEELYNGH